MKNERLKSLLLLAITAVFWSLGGIFIKLVNWNPIAIAGARSTIAAIILLIYLKKPKINWSKAQIGATLSYAATVILFVSSTKLTTAANAILLQFTAPIYVALFSGWFLDEKIKLKEWITTFFVIFGMTLFFFDHLSLQGLIGNLTGIISGISFAFFTIFMRMQKDSSPLESVFLGNILTALVCLPFMFNTLPNQNDFLCLLVLGVLQLGLPYIFYSKAIKNVSAMDAVLIPVIEPLLNPIWVLILLDEVPGRWAISGGVIVITAITLRYFVRFITSGGKK